MLEPEHAAHNVAWNGYPQPVTGGTDEFSRLVKEEPSIDVTIEQLEEGEEYVFATPQGRRLWAETWTEIKA